MKIDVTRFVRNEDPYKFSASIMEMGANAGRLTWNNAKREGEQAPLLTTEDQLDALRSHVRGFGAWDEDEIAAWSDAECNALFVQLISGDMRQMGLDDCDVDEFDWQAYEARSDGGGSLYLSGDRFYYYLGD